MAINVPVSTPNSPQFQPPDSLVQGYLNRPNAAMVAQQGLGSAFNAAALYKQYQTMKQLEALKTISELYGAGGPRAVTAYGPTINRVAGTDVLGGSENLPPATYQSQGQPSAAISQAPAQQIGGITGTQSNTPSSILSHPAIIADANQRGWDLNHPGYGQANPQQSSVIPQPSAEDIADIQSGGTYGLNKGKSFEALGTLAMQPLQAQKLAGDVANIPVEAATKAQELVNKKEQIPFEIGKGTAEQQNKYQLPEMKIQVANTKLQDLYDAYNKIPDSQKGAGVGAITSKMGSIAGGVSPNLVTYNKLREAAAVSLAIARNPENPRPSPQDIADELKNLPSAGDSAEVATNLFNSTSHDLQHIHALNTQGAQASAGAFGGKIQPGQTPQLRMNQQPQSATKQGPPISSKAQYDALPNGTPYTWNGIPHVKGKS